MKIPFPLRRLTRFVACTAALLLIGFARAGVEPKILTFMPSDFNGDGHADILWRHAGSGWVHRMLMLDFTIAQADTVYVEPDAAWKIVGTGDFNGDGKTDVLWHHATTGHVYMMLFDYNGRPTPSSGHFVYHEPDTDWKIVDTSDLDGDGFADILWWHATSGRVYALLMRGILVEREGDVHRAPDTAWRIVAVGRFDSPGEGRQLLWRHRVSGEVYLQRITYTGGAFSQWGQTVYFEPDPAWRIVSAPDLDGDRRADILWRNEDTGQVYGMLMLGGYIKAQGTVYVEPDTAWDVVATYDYDLDSRADLLWRNALDGRVFMMRMNGLAIAAAATIYAEPDPAWEVMGPPQYARHREP